MKLPTPLVTAIEGEARASSLVIANGLSVPHENVLKLLRKHRETFNEISHLDFKSVSSNRTQGGGRMVEYAMLNEHQAAPPPRRGRLRMLSPKSRRMNYQ